MAGPRRSVCDYVADRIAQLQDLGALVRSVKTHEFPNGHAAIHAHLEFGEENPVKLTVFEHVQLGPDGKTAHRLKYGYHAARAGEPIFQYDRDPTGHPEMPEHVHVPGSDRRRPSGSVTLHEIADKIWEHLGITL